MRRGGGKGGGRDLLSIRIIRADPSIRVISLLGLLGLFGRTRLRASQALLCTAELSDEGDHEHRHQHRGSYDRLSHTNINRGDLRLLDPGGLTGIGPPPGLQVVFVHGTEKECRNNNNC